MNKAKRIVDNMDSENAFEVCSEIGIIDENATPLKQARYINELLNTTESMKIPMTDTMRKCGGCCLSTNAIKIAKWLKELAETKSHLRQVFYSCFELFR